MNILRLALPLLAVPLLIGTRIGSAQTSASPLLQITSAQINQELDRIQRHQSADWQLVAPHLPDPATAKPQDLQIAGDVLRARRMPEDALEYYQYAMLRGGEERVLRNRIGITQLELHQPELARIAFNRALKIDRKDAAAWNNLGATQYLVGDYRGAIDHYRHAIKINRKSAVYHSNLGTAYFEMADYDSARSEFTAAVRLDPRVFDDGGWSGLQAHVISTHDRGRFCVEMARLAAINHDDAGVLHWLNMAVSTDFDSVGSMLSDTAFAAYRKDARVLLMLQNARILRRHQIATTAPLPPLSSVQDKENLGR